MKLFLAVAALALWVGEALAQSDGPGKITGVLTDSTTTQPVPFATVALRNATALLGGTTTDSTGTFRLANLQPGSYTLTLSSVGYQTKIQSVILTADQPTAQLGTLPLRSESRMLKEVTVSAQKALIEEKGDRLVYNAEKDVSNVGGSAADVLRKVPALSLDLDGNIQLRGNSNIRVLINGKPSAMMARNLADALRQMPADNIKSVEVITSPGAKYDAEGAAGVINIITKKAVQGFNGSVIASVGTLNRSTNLKLAAKTKKVGVSLSANGYQFRNIREAQTFRTTLANGQPLNYLTQWSNADNTGTGGYGEFSLDYDPDSTSRFNLSANAWGGSYPNNSSVVNRLTDPAGNVLQYFRNDIQFRNPYGNSQFDLGYTKTFRKRPGVTAQPELALLTQYSRMPDNYFYDTDRYTLDEVERLSFRQHSTNYSRNKEYTLQLDYTYPFMMRTGSGDTTQLKLETGLKAIRRDIGSEYRVEQSVDGQQPFVPDPTQSNDFEYYQRIYSGYTALRVETKQKWNLNLGARLERTVINGDFLTTQTTLANQYTNLIPSLTVSKGLKTHTLKLSYTQRIQRPQLWYLNPWVNASDPRNLVTGNPYLNPELSHAVELGHSVSTKAGLSINSAFYWRLTDNAIEYVRTVDAAGVSLSKPQNIAQRRAYGLNLNVSGSATKNWTLNGGLDLRYVALNSPSLNQANSGVVGNFNINSTLKLPNNYTFQANGNVNSGWISLQGNGSSFYWYGFALKREMMAKKASLTLGVNNPFNRGVSQTMRQSAPTFESEARSFFLTRSARLAFEWRFGQMSSGGKQTRKISNDDGGSR